MASALQEDLLKTVSFGEVDDEPGQKKKNAKKKQKSGGTFQALGFTNSVCRAVTRKGYKLATPIQRKTIPSILDGRDVVAMARTGSGKTAAFVLPMIERLKQRQAKCGIRALIISPVRELARQTAKFTRDFMCFTDLRMALITGGESIDKDFEDITSSPDILIATPGRLAHVLVDMKQNLPTVEYVVFDEADRLFEPGYKELDQVLEICNRLSDQRQTLLFSATMPQKLADFAKVGLKDPLLVRLDVESNLSSNLKTIHLNCSENNKTAVLLYLLQKFVKKEQMTVVFLPTRHHVEYIKIVLTNANIRCNYVYSSLDPEARKINVESFQKQACRVLLVTDVAARGIDIPILDNVINYNFPFKPKLFVHRVGRVARAGRSGCAISLVSHEESPYLHALHLFLGKPVTCANTVKLDEVGPSADPSSMPDSVYGAVPQALLDDQNDMLARWHHHNIELEGMLKVCDNAMKPYLKTRAPPGAESVRIMKQIHRKPIGTHPLFKIGDCAVIGFGSTTSEQIQKDEEAESNLLDRIKSYKPAATIFEVGHIKGNRSTEAFGVMQKKRIIHDKIVEKQNETSDEDDNNWDPTSTNSNKRKFIEDKYFVNYLPEASHKEKGLEIDKTSFNRELNHATFDLVADDENVMKKQRNQMIWDRKKKKFVRSDQLTGKDKPVKKIRTESGALINASYQSGLYEKWKDKAKVDHRALDSDNSDEETPSKGKPRGKQGRNKGNNSGKKRPDPKSVKKIISNAQNKSGQKKRKVRPELRRPEVILKERMIKDKREALIRLKNQRKATRNAQRNT